MDNTEKGGAMIIHPVPLEAITKIIDSGQWTCAREVAELSNMGLVEEDAWPKEVIFLVFPPLSMKNYLEVFEFGFKFRIQRCQWSIFVNLDFIGIAVLFLLEEPVFEDFPRYGSHFRA